MHADVTIHSLTFTKTIDAWYLVFGCYATAPQTVNKQTNFNAIYSFVVFMRIAMMHERYCELLFKVKNNFDRNQCRVNCF